MSKLLDIQYMCRCVRCVPARRRACLFWAVINAEILYVYRLICLVAAVERICSLSHKQAAVCHEHNRGWTALLLLYARIVLDVEGRAVAPVAATAAVIASKIRLASPATCTCHLHYTYTCFRMSPLCRFSFQEGFRSEPQPLSLPRHQRQQQPQHRPQALPLLRQRLLVGSRSVPLRRRRRQRQQRRRPHPLLLPLPLPRLVPRPLLQLQVCIYSLVHRLHC